MAKGNTQIPYWVFYNTKRRCIWHDMFPTREAALEAFTDLAKKYGRGDWIVEKHFYWGSEVDKLFNDL